MTPPADLVNELRDIARQHASDTGLSIARFPEWQAAAALSSTQARADKLEEELVEAKRQVEFMSGRVNEMRMRKDAAESSLTQARERIAEFEKNLEAQSTLATEMTQLASDYGYALEKIDGFTMSQFAKIEDMLAACKLVATNALKSPAGEGE